MSLFPEHSANTQHFRNFNFFPKAVQPTPIPTTQTSNIKATRFPYTGRTPRGRSPCGNFPIRQPSVNHLKTARRRHRRSAAGPERRGKEEPRGARSLDLRRGVTSATAIVVFRAFVALVFTCFRFEDDMFLFVLISASTRREGRKTIVPPSCRTMDSRCRDPGPQRGTSLHGLTSR